MITIDLFSADTRNMALAEKQAKEKTLEELTKEDNAERDSTLNRMFASLSLID